MQPSCSARVSQRQPGLAPVLVCQRDDIVVDPLLQLLDLLGRGLGGEHSLRLGHRSIGHCCRGEGGRCLLLPEESRRLPRATLQVLHLPPGEGAGVRKHKGHCASCRAPVGSLALVNSANTH